MKFSRLIAIACLSLLFAGPTWAQEEKQMEKKEQKEVCSHPEGWAPTKDEMQGIKARHRQWLQHWEDYRKGKKDKIGSYELETPPPGEGYRANFCNVDWNNADLRLAELNYAILALAQLNNANLSFAELNNARLTAAKLNNADLSSAQLNNADLRWAQLKGAILSGVSLTGAKLAGADLTNAYYSPQPGTPDPDVADIKGLNTVRIEQGQETGLVQLRDLLQKGGLRDLEREATFTIEYWRTRFTTFPERFFRMAAFEWTTGYGLYPGRALKIIGVTWLLLSLIYFWPICLAPKGSSTAGIYQVWPGDRIETSGGAVSLSNSSKVNRLKKGPLAALGYAAYFSLLSAFYIGWRELNVGSWIARIQPREYTLRATGWVRVISGVQSLLSVYLLAIWVLTYFGRPFQ